MPVLLNSLDRVTYRGYDSFGVALLNGTGITVSRGIGTVEEHRDEIEQLSGTLGGQWPPSDRPPGDVPASLPSPGGVHRGVARGLA